MKIGCVKEIKNNEFRVGLTPDNVKAYIAHGHEVLIEKGAGLGSGFPDAEYEAAGAKMVEAAPAVSSPTCTSQPTVSRPKHCSAARSRASPTRPSSRRTALSPFWPR